MNDLGFLAHQGGWDEILMVAGPLAVFAVVLYLANRRANLRLATSTDESTTAQTSNVDEASDEPENPRST